MLMTVKKISSLSSCNGNILERIIGTTSFNSNCLGLPSSRNQFRSFFLLSNGCLFNSTHRVLATSDNYHVPIEKANEMNYFWEDYAKNLSFKRRCINKVCTYLKCNEKTATDLVAEHSILFLEDIENTFENIQLLTEKGVSPVTLLKNLWILYFDHEDLRSRVSAVFQWNIDGYSLEDFVAVFKLSPDEFQKISKAFIDERDTVPFGNRIIYLAKLLEVPVSRLALQLVRHKYLLRRNIDLISESIKSYQEFGISGKDLLQDIWALRYNEYVIKRRLRIAQTNKIIHLKPWMVRCSEEIFEKALETNEVERSIMHPFETREEFLANKMGIDLSVMKTVVQRNDIFHKIHMVKLAEMVDYLLDVGFRPTDICSSCRIFYFSLETITDRMNELKRLGVEMLSISMLITDQNKFQKLVERIEYVNNLKKNLKK